jgi:thiosulfate/3-mercaptopyruvate sulfurtransferase
LATLVNLESVERGLEQHEITLIDPRRPMKYLSGHLPGALNVPAYKAFGADGQLLKEAQLAAFIGAAGIDNEGALVLYDSPEGQNAAMLAWILEYLGRPDVRVMAAFFEAWKGSGREVLYRPVTATPRTFVPRLAPAGRITAKEARAATGLRFVDFRSVEEFSGKKSIGDDRPGHIPGAVNIVWRDLTDPPHKFLKPRAELFKMLTDAGLAPGEKIVAYCRSGPRAALGYMALREAGFDARLFDGSWIEWSRRGLPAEK